MSGKNPTDQYLDGMMVEAPGPINFTMFLTMFGEKLNGTDPEDVIKNAFGCFDEDNSGRFTESGVHQQTHFAFCDKSCVAPGAGNEKQSDKRECFESFVFDSVTCLRMHTSFRAVF